MAADGLAAIYAANGYERMRRGFDALVHGVREEHDEDRIHQYVRALEGLVKPEIGRSETQFVHRCQTFAVASDQARTALRDSYAIRSQVEHVHFWGDALTPYPEADRASVLTQRLLQIEALALYTYIRVVTSRPHRDIFVADSSIDAFWAKRDDERFSLWGDRLDLSDALKQ